MMMRTGRIPSSWHEVILEELDDFSEAVITTDEVEAHSGP